MRCRAGAVKCSSSASACTSTRARTRVHTHTHTHTTPHTPESQCTQGGAGPCVLATCTQDASMAAHAAPLVALSRGVVGRLCMQLEGLQRSTQVGALPWLPSPLLEWVHCCSTRSSSRLGAGGLLLSLDWAVGVGAALGGPLCHWTGQFERVHCGSTIAVKKCRL